MIIIQIMEKSNKEIHIFTKNYHILVSCGIERRKIKKFRRFLPLCVLICGFIFLRDVNHCPGCGAGLSHRLYPVSLFSEKQPESCRYGFEKPE